MALCDTCGETTAHSALFCPRCGTTMAPSPPETRRTVTVVFTDVVDSTPLGERLDAEAFRQVLRRWFAIAEEVLSGHGGTVEKFIGDAVMAVFGLPRAHEDDALRAVLAAIELRNRLDVLNADLELTVGATLATRTGINTGEVVAGEPAARGQLVAGDAVNVAKRLEQAAGGGEILIGAATAALVREAATLVPVPPVEAKGKTEPLQAWRVVAAGRPPHGLSRQLDAPLVDREDELRRLLAALARCEETGRGVLVTVTGAPGIGKSRLARELVTTSQDRARTLVGRCPAYGHAITYRPISELLEEAGGEEAVASALVGDADAEIVLTRLRAATGTPTEATASDEIFWAIRRALEALAADRALIVVLDDAHWAEPTLLDLVEYLSAFAQARMLLICLARPELLEDRPAWPGERIELEPLADADATTLLEELGVEEADRRRIADAAEGNPLFLEQLSAMLAEGVQTDGMPPSIHALLDERLDRLEPGERDALTHASVIGREFSLSALQSPAQDASGSGVATHLLSLVRKGLLRPGPHHEREDVFRFRHALIRDAAYDRLAKSDRAVLHERYAEWFAHRAPPGHAGLDELVGFHLEQAHRWLAELGRLDAPTDALGHRAHRHLAAAADGALAREDMPTAVKLIARALALPAGDRARAELRLELIQALWETGDATLAEREIDTLLEEAGVLGDARLEAAANLERAAHQQITGAAGTDAVRGAAHAAIAIFEPACDTLGLARAWRRVSTADSRDGRYRDCARAAEVALRYAREAENGLEVARIVDGLCTALLYGPIPVDEALAECDELLGDAREAPSTEANILCAIAGLEAMRGNADEARAAYAHAADTFESLGLLLPRAGQTQIGVVMELLLGDAVAAEREGRLGYEILEAIESEQIQAPLLAEALLALGRHGEAESLVDPINPASSSFLVPWQVRCRIVKAGVASRRGDVHGAIELAHEATELADATDDPNLGGDAWMALTDALETGGDHDRAAAGATEALERYRRKGNVLAAARAETVASIAN